MSYLLTGYCYLAKAKLSNVNHEVNEEWAQKAARNLNLAFDLSRGNSYIESSALQNLGMVEFLLKNYGLAASTFTARTKIGFSDQRDEFAHRWFEARALFFANDPAAAADSLLKAISLKQDDNEKFAVTERLAFYSVYAGRDQFAANTYKNLVADKKFIDLQPANKAKILLNYGYVLFKIYSDKNSLEKPSSDEVYDVLQLSMTSATAGYQGSERYLKHALSAVGLMAQLESVSHTGESEKIKRRELIFEAKKKPEAYSVSDLTLNNWFLKNELQLYKLYFKHQKPANAALSLNTALKYLVDNYKKNDALVGTEAYITLSTTLIEGIVNPEVVAVEKSTAGLIEQLVKSSTVAYDNLDKKHPVWQLQKIKINLLYALFQKKNRAHTGSVSLSGEWKGWFDDDRYKPLLSDAQSIDSLRQLLIGLGASVI